MKNENTLDIETGKIPFRVRIVEKGQKYGLNSCLSHDNKEPLVEFYDKRFPHTEHGQFVSRYYLSTLTERDNSNGLNLSGGVPNWSIDGDTMNQVTAWLKNYQQQAIAKEISNSLKPTTTPPGTVIKK